jgi:3-dehydroquinate synthase
LGNYSAKFVDSIADIESLIDSPNTFVFIDKKVQDLYPSLYRQNNIAVDCIESNKTFEMSNIILQRMVDLGIKSNSTILVIGGGILQDLIGFCCSVYHRGVKYILIPTTLLAQADSCVGGKTSINFNKKKNLLGTFYPPKEIIICTGFLDTLEPLEYVSGMGEIFKFHILQNKMNTFESALDRTRIDETVFESLVYKKHILDVDEFDLKERKFLNFGHTFGHALEFTSDNKIPHGVGVILGSVTSCILSNKLGFTVSNFDLIVEHAKNLLTGITLEKEWFSLNSILEAAKQDKKNTGKIIDVLISDSPKLVPIEDISLIETALLDTFQLFTTNETI